ncbi:MAG TPA: recombinase family protein [Bacillota bacterium]|nr:recombinase family protein [Bacillota bacterium]
MKLPEWVEQIICYLRRSRQDIEKERKTGEDTLAQQKQIMERVLADYNLPYQVFEEIGSGDKIETRPVFCAVLDLLEEGKYKAIAVRELSRLGRGSYTDMGRIYDLIIQKDILIITPYKIYNPTNHADLRQIRFELFLSREEFETIKERLMSGKTASAMQGKWSSGGTAPFGYRVNDNTQKLEIYEDEAKIVRMIFDLYVYGLEGKEKGFRAIATYLTRNGNPSPSGMNNWNVSMVKKILIEKQELYAGSFLFGTTKMVNGKKIKKQKEEWIIVGNSHPGIINEEMLEKVKKKHQLLYKTRTKVDFNTSELAGLLICSKCGRKMIRQANYREYISKKTGEITIHSKETLWCNTIGCTFVSYRAVEEALLEFLATIGHLKDEDFQVFIQQTQEKHNVDLHGEERIQLATETKNHLIKKLAFIYEKFEEGIYSKEEFITRREGINQKIGELEKTIRLLLNVESPARKLQVDINQMKQILLSVYRTYRTIENTEEKNRILHGIIDHAVLELTEKVRGNKPSRFNLDVYFRMEDFLIL